MVTGHTLDAVLSKQARLSPGMVAYWHARGLTAPLFMLVSGWAVTLAISRSGDQGIAIPRGRLKRVLLLLAIGYALRWPGWGLDRFLAGDRDVWAHFLAFDALHTIALSLLATSLVLALPIGRLGRSAALAALALSAVRFGQSATLPGGAPATAGGLPQSLPLMALAQALHGTSPFPVLPWSAYFFAGTLVGLLAPQDWRGAAAMALAGATLVAVTVPFPGLGEREAGDPVLIAFRIGRSWRSWAPWNSSRRPWPSARRRSEEAPSASMPSTCPWSTAGPPCPGSPTGWDRPSAPPRRWPWRLWCCS